MSRQASVLTHDHPLDRPAWNALTTLQSGFAIQVANAVRIAPDVGVFIAGRDDSAASLAAVGALIDLYPGSAFLEAAVSPRAALLPAGTRIDYDLTLVQMVCPSLAAARSPDPDIGIRELGDADAGPMTALAAATWPGPFADRTWQLGDFIGVFHEGLLIAIAGQRLRIDGFIEISAVCTAPEHRGRGLARLLIRRQAGRILSRGATPFLHAVEGNAGAIALYESLGFRTRERMAYIVMR